MLENLLSSNEFDKELRGSLVGPAEAVKKVFRKWEAKFAAIENGTFRQRADVSWTWRGEFCVSWKA
jgi:hypothetical protein